MKKQSGSQFKYVRIRTSLIDELEHVTVDVCGDLLLLILDFANDKNVPHPGGYAGEIYNKMLPQLKRDNWQLGDTSLYCIKMYKYHDIDAGIDGDYDCFCKIGVTYNTSERYNQFKDMGYDVVEVAVKKFKVREHAEEVEAILHDKFRDQSYFVDDYFPGASECFNECVTDQINW